MEQFSARHCHQAYSWISGTTYHNRIKARLTPTINKPSDKGTGTGTGYRFTMAGLIHVGVIDELMSVGFGKAGVSGTESQIDFIPAPEFEDSWLKIATGTDHENALRFYEIHHYFCFVDVSIQHTRVRAKGLMRRKRADRVFYVAFVPDHTLYPGSPADGWLSRGIEEDGKAFTVFTRTRINVAQLYGHVTTALGL